MRIYFFTITFLTFCFSSCSNQPEGSSVEDLTGTWSVISASRNGKTISTLENVYLEFNANQELTSNLPLNPATDVYTVPFEFEKDVISYTLGNQPYSLAIEQLADTLILNTNIRNAEFKLVLARQSSSETESGN